MQRLMRYPMLLQGLLRALPDDHPHRAKLTAAEKEIKQVELVIQGVSQAFSWNLVRVGR